MNLVDDRDPAVFRIGDVSLCSIKLAPEGKDKHSLWHRVLQFCLYA
jgi:hypothetical protein